MGCAPLALSELLLRQAQTRFAPTQDFKDPIISHSAESLSSHVAVSFESAYMITYSAAKVKTIVQYSTANMDVPGDTGGAKQEDAIRQQQMHRELSPRFASTKSEQIRQFRGIDLFKIEPPALPDIPSPLPTLPTTNPFEGPVHLFGHPK